MVRGAVNAGRTSYDDLRPPKGPALLRSGLALQWSPGSISGRGDSGAIPRAQWDGGLLVVLGALLPEWTAWQVPHRVLPFVWKLLSWLETPLAAGLPAPIGMNAST